MLENFFKNTDFKSSSLHGKSTVLQSRNPYAAPWKPMTPNISNVNILNSVASVGILTTRTGYTLGGKAKDSQFFPQRVPSNIKCWVSKCNSLIMSNSCNEYQIYILMHGKKANRYSNIQPIATMASNPQNQKEDLHIQLL